MPLALIITCIWIPPKRQLNLNAAHFQYRDTLTLSGTLNHCCLDESHGDIVAEIIKGLVFIKTIFNIIETQM